MLVSRDPSQIHHCKLRTGLREFKWRSTKAQKIYYFIDSNREVISLHRASAGCLKTWSHAVLELTIRWLPTKIAISSITRGSVTSKARLKGHSMQSLCRQPLDWHLRPAQLAWRYFVTIFGQRKKKMNLGNRLVHKRAAEWNYRATST